MHKVIQPLKSMHVRPLSNSKNTGFVPVTLLGQYHFNQPWFPLCASTWPLADFQESVKIINDGTLSQENISELFSKNLIVLDREKCEFLVDEVLAIYPAIRTLRNKSKLFKKIIDTSILFSDRKVLFIDSDVIFRAPFTLPQTLPSLLFCVDEVPGYGGDWRIPLKFPIVTGLNSGFIYFDPKILDIEFLEFIASRFLINSNNVWWLEQTCWALIAGSVSEKGVFCAEDACVISGLLKRSPQELRQNKTFYFRKSSRKLVSEEVYSLIGSAAVVHCAGPAKPWIAEILEKPLPDEGNKRVRELHWLPVTNANWKEKIFLSIRMKIQG